MKIAAVIAEYNPFHNGHAYQLRRIKEDYGYDFIIVVMSGDFTQRGEPAITDKHMRTRMALLGGADLVIELPAYYACASAEYFATGAVSLLHGLGCVDALFFGSESEDTDASRPVPPVLFMHAAGILFKEPPVYRNTLADSLKHGRGYAAARIDALAASIAQSDAAETAPSDMAAAGADTAAATQLDISAMHHIGSADRLDTPIGASFLPETDKLLSVLSLPNNTLGIEYCKALLRMHSPIKPFAIRRIGGGYHDTDTANTYASAEAIRALLFPRSVRDCSSSEHMRPPFSSAPDAPVFDAERPRCATSNTQNGNSVKALLSALVPHDTAQMLTKSYQSQQLLTQNNFSDLVRYRLLLQESQLERYADCTAALANRIRSLMPSLAGQTVTNMIGTIKTRTYTHTRISRVLTHLLLDMTTDRLSALTDQNTPAFLTHARILGFRKNACGTLLPAVKKHSCIPLVTKPSDYHPLGEAAMLYETDLLASHIYQSIACAKSGQSFRHELTRSPLIL